MSWQELLLSVSLLSETSQELISATSISQSASFLRNSPTRAPLMIFEYNSHNPKGIKATVLPCIQKKTVGKSSQKDKTENNVKQSSTSTWWYPSSDFGMEWWITKRTSGLLIPADIEMRF
jgi:hypothetical protein